MTERPYMSFEEAKKKYYRNIEEGIPNNPLMVKIMTTFTKKSQIRKNIETKMKNINQWVFACDGKTWRAAKREDYRELFNDHNSEKVLKSSSIDTLTELIQRTGGDLNEIKKLL